MYPIRSICIILCSIFLPLHAMIEDDGNNNNVSTNRVNTTNQNWCPECNLTFLSKQAMTLHKKFHNWWKKGWQAEYIHPPQLQLREVTQYIDIEYSRNCFQCMYPGCNANLFRRFKEIERHIRGKHLPSPKNAYMCKICNYYNTQLFRLEKHIDGHWNNGTLSHPDTTEIAPQEECGDENQQEHSFESKNKESPLTPRMHIGGAFASHSSDINYKSDSATESDDDDEYGPNCGNSVRVDNNSTAKRKRTINVLHTQEEHSHEQEYACQPKNKETLLTPRAHTCETLVSRSSGVNYTSDSATESDDDNEYINK